jgi:hypothetical protein
MCGIENTYDVRALKLVRHEMTLVFRDGHIQCPFRMYDPTTSRHVVVAEAPRKPSTERPVVDDRVPCSLHVRHAHINTTLPRWVMEETIGLPQPKLRLVALIPHHGAEFEEMLVFTDEDTALRYWRALPNRDCVAYVPMFEDIYSDAWVLSHSPITPDE